MTTVKAAVCHAFGENLRIEDIRLPEPGVGEVEVKLDAVAICHSDITFIDGGWGGDLPAVYGHEAAGRITGLGTGVTIYTVGQRVLVTLIKSCGACPSCATASPATCTGNESTEPSLALADGTAVSKVMECGAFAEAVVVHQSQIAALPDDIEADSACLLACGVITGVGAVVNTAQVRPGQNVVVIGAGGVGLNAIQGARIAGAARVIAVDVAAEKMADARTFGATDVVLASDADLVQQVSDITHGNMADAVFITVGAIPAYQQSLKLLARGGTAYAVGMPHTGATLEHEPGDLASLGQGLKGSKMGDTVLARDIPWLIDLYRQDRLKLDDLISKRWSLDEINEAIADTKTGHSRRNVIVFA